MYQNQSDLSSSENIDVDEFELLPDDDSESLETNNQIGSPSVAVDPSNAKSSPAKSIDSSDLSSGFELLRDDDSEILQVDKEFGSSLVAVDPSNAEYSRGKASDAEWSNGQLLLCIVAIALLIAALVWFLENIGERFERFQKRLRRWPNKSDWGHGSTGLVEFPIANGELPPTATERTIEDLGGFGDPASLERNALLKPERVETVESEQDIRHNKFQDMPKENRTRVDSRSRMDSPVLEFQSDETAALQQQLAEQANELKTLKKALDEENRVTLEDAETRYQKLADELAASQLAQSQIQTELANAHQSLESLTSKNTRAEQEMETAYQELRGKGDFVGQLESKLVSSESLAASLEEKLKLAQSDLKNQLQQTLAADSRIDEIENDALQLNQQLEEQRKGEVSKSGEVESLTAKLAERTVELEKLQSRFDEAAASSDEKAASLEESKVRYKNLVGELEELKVSETQTQSQYQSELATAQEENRILSSKAEQAKNGLDTAYREMLNKGDIAAGLHEENENLKSSLKKTETQLATLETDAKKASESKETAQAQLKEETERYEQSTQEVESELESARQEITELQQNAESSKSELAQHLTKHAQEIENLESCLEETAKEKQMQLVENEKLDSIVAKTESELASAQAEIADLKLELADNSAAAEETAALQEQLEEINARADLSKLELAKNSTKFVQEIEDLESRLEETAKEKQTQLVENEKLDSIVAKAESELASAQAEIADLKLELADNSAAAEETAALQEKLEEAIAQADVSLKQIDSLTSEFGELKNQLDLKTEELHGATTSRAKRDDQWAELDAQSKLLEQRAKEAELKLAETSESLAKKQASYADLETAAKQDMNELKLQVSKYSELEASVESLENQMLAAQRELTDTVRLLEQEKSTREEIENTVKQQTEELSVLSSRKSNIEAELKPLEMRAQEADAELNTQQSRALELEAIVKSLESQIQETSEKLEQTTSELDKTQSLQIELEKITEQQKTQLSQKEIQCAELEAKLRETVESNTDKVTSESQKLERQGLELDELRFALQNEEVQRSEVLEKLKSSQIRIAELEQQSQASSIDESNYNKLLAKLVKYKTFYRKNIAFAEELAQQNSKVSELAAEYRDAAKILRRDLDAQLETTAELKRRLDHASSDGGNPSDLNLLVQERARAHVLALKAKFEERIKKKNKLIRKLKNQDPIQS